MATGWMPRGVLKQIEALRERRLAEGWVRDKAAEAPVEPGPDAVEGEADAEKS